MNPFSSSTNKEKRKEKNFMMMHYSQNGQSKNQVFLQRKATCAMRCSVEKKKNRMKPLPSKFPILQIKFNLHFFENHSKKRKKMKGNLFEGEHSGYFGDNIRDVQRAAHPCTSAPSPPPLSCPHLVGSRSLEFHVYLSSISFV